MIDFVPGDWFVHNMGYKYMVNVRPILVTTRATWANLWNWLETHFGGISSGAWITHGDVICFRNKADASLFDMTWNSTL